MSDKKPTSPPVNVTIKAVEQDTGKVQAGNNGPPPDTTAIRVSPAPPAKK